MRPLIRFFSEDDNIEAITDVIHAAYAPHAAAGLRYWGTHQTPDQTKRRFESGFGLIMLSDGKCIGTAIVRPPQPESEALLYRNPRIWSLSQFCISPSYKGFGYGRLLHAHALSVAAAAGADFIALDTAAPASALITMYRRWGYNVIGSCDWRPHTNYESVLMCRAITNADNTIEPFQETHSK